MISSSGGFGSGDRCRQELGCPNVRLNLQADVAHTCTSLGIMEEEDLIKSPPFSAYSVS